MAVRDAGYLLLGEKSAIVLDSTRVSNKKIIESGFTFKYEFLEQALKNFYGDFIIKDFAVRKSEDINTAAKLGKPLPFFAKKNSIALADIVDLVFLILNIYTE
jgi:hypothetical protein